MIINLHTPLPRGKYKGKTILEIAPSILEGDWNYISWIINNWSDKFAEDVEERHGWSAYCQKTGFGSSVGITNDDTEKNN